MTSKVQRSVKVVVIAKCPTCGYKREIGPNEVGKDEYPLCPNDGMPLIAQQARKR